MRVQLVGLCGGTVVREGSVLDAFRQHKDFRPEGIAALNPAGVALARVPAEELALVVDAASEGGHHA